MKKLFLFLACFAIMSCSKGNGYSSWENERNAKLVGTWNLHKDLSEDLLNSEFGNEYEILRPDNPAKLQFTSGLKITGMSNTGRILFSYPYELVPYSELFPESPNLEEFGLSDDIVFGIRLPDKIGQISIISGKLYVGIAERSDLSYMFVAAMYAK